MLKNKNKKNCKFLFLYKKLNSKRKLLCCTSNNQEIFMEKILALQILVTEIYISLTRRYFDNFMQMASRISAGWQFSYRRSALRRDIAIICTLVHYTIVALSDTLQTISLNCSAKIATKVLAVILWSLETS